MDKPHSLKIEQGNCTIIGVTNVSDFDEKEITCELHDKKLKLTGGKLTILDLDVAEQRLVVSGEIIGVLYSKQAEKVSFIKRLLK